MKIWLIGMMGSGKTSAGRLAASRLGVEFWDTDEIVAQRAGTSIAQLWADEGEPAFRELEEAVVGEVADQNGIVATGGGVVLRPANRETMRESGVVVWLDASPPVLAARIATETGRPLLDSGDQEALEVLRRTLSERAVLYAETAHHRLSTDDIDVDAASERIEGLWRS
jgi:shikimate kinase